MRQDLTKALNADFPLLFGGDTHFECGDGWEPLIRGLAQKLEPIIRDWTESVEWEDLHDRMRAVQVKEKFGGLRFYMGSYSDEIEAHIREAECQSFRTCEECGNYGTQTRSGWIHTLCALHHALRYTLSEF